MNDSDSNAFMQFSPIYLVKIMLAFVSS